MVNVGRDGVHTVSTNEVPINFKASENGTYTLSFIPEGVQMAHLHLIDNLTGADVDLLATEHVEGPVTYTFDARTTDYESRFKLVFAVGSSTGSDTFAFISNGNIIVTGVGGDAFNASLQVIDMTGRIVRRRDALNASSTSLPTAGMAPGVYMLRLINGDNIKVQKIVVE